MNKILKFPALILFGLATMFLVGCEGDDGTGGGDVLKPSISITSASDLTLLPGEEFTIDFTASKGTEDNALKAITVYEDGVKVPVARLKFNGTAAVANPALIVGDDKEGLNWSVSIIAHTTAGVSETYSVEVQADDNQVSEASITVDIAATPPTFTSTSNPDAMNVPQDTKLSFRLTAVKGSGDLVLIEVLENGIAVDPVSIFWDNISMSVASNPFSLEGDDVFGFEDKELFIMTPMSEGTFMYKVIITDSSGLTSELNFNVTTVPDTPTGTPVDIRTGILLNSEGPIGTGGLDLDNLDNNNGSVGSSEGEGADIRDNGFVPGTGNWAQTISPVGSSMIKYLRAGEGGLPEGFTFDSIDFKEGLSSLFDNGITFTQGVSDFLVIGDVFVVEKSNSFWVLEVTNIEVTDNDNADKYTFNVKF